MIDRELAQEIAQRLHDAERTRTTIKQISQLHPELNVEDAYAIQRAGVVLAAADGRVVKGRKIGLTSRAMQQAVNIEEPDYGVLYEDMFYADGDTIPFERFIAPRVEVELAFVLGRPLRGPGCTLEQVLAATDHVTPAVEILDARFQMTDPDSGSSRTIVDTIADNAADAAIVTGGRPVRPDEVDLRWVAALLTRQGVIEESGVAAAVLDHPGNGVAWLADRLAGHGDSLEAGQLILSGSFIRPVWVRAGDTFCADYGPLGTITFAFTPG
jgi:2-oxo-hept-3-ene-1,7-dioate hydratase